MNSAKLLSGAKELAPGLRREWPLFVSLITTALFLAFGDGWMADLSNLAWFAVFFAWLFGTILLSAFAVV
jgi:Ca2+:H+ antiporter